MTHLLLLFFACAQPCEFVAFCDGSVLNTCSLGVDQLFGSGERQVDCAETVNPVCHSPAPDVAFCTVDDTVTCNEGESRCEGDLALECNSQGFEVATDCADFGPTCVVHEQEATCGVDPVTPCDSSTFERRCDGDAGVITCLSGVEARLACDPGEVCGLSSLDRLGCLEP